MLHLSLVILYARFKDRIKNEPKAKAYIQMFLDWLNTSIS